uniref:Uncharacterized protein n=1 Tax=Arundo donax TaxID=35708 RepID=A0A0A8ZNB3_ARUDO
MVTGSPSCIRSVSDKPCRGRYALSTATSSSSSTHATMDFIWM